MKALDRLDKYFAVADAPGRYEGASRARLLAKLDRVAARYGIVVPPDGPPASTAEATNLEGGQLGFGGPISP